MDGAEVVQLYVGLKNANVFRPAKELKGFKKVFIPAGQSVQVRIDFDDKTFRYWNVKTGKWEVEEGDYDIMIGRNVNDIVLNESLHVNGTTTEYPYVKSDMEHYYGCNIQQVPDKEFETLLGYSIPLGKWSGELGPNDAICQLYYSKSGLARFVYKKLTKMKKKAEDAGKPDLNILFIYNMPFRAMAKMTGGAVSREMVSGIVKIVNGHFWSGLGRVIKGYFKNSSANKKYEKKING
jgi:beta-glucosidase